MDYELYHHGVLGMKWGVRKAKKTSTPSKKSTKKNDDTPRGPKKFLKKDRAVEKSRKKPVREFTDDELREKINRLQLEKQYKTLMEEGNQQKSKRGKDLALRVLEKSGENIATQILNHYGAKIANNLIGETVIYANNKKK